MIVESVERWAKRSFIVFLSGLGDCKICAYHNLVLLHVCSYLQCLVYLARVTLQLFMVKQKGLCILSIMLSDKINWANSHFKWMHTSTVEVTHKDYSVANLNFFSHLHSMIGKSIFNRQDLAKGHLLNSKFHSWIQSWTWMKCTPASERLERRVPLRMFHRLCANLSRI